MSNTSERLMMDLHESFHKNPTALVGDTTWCKLVEEAKKVWTSFSPQIAERSNDKERGTMLMGGFTIMTNHLPGTCGWIIGDNDVITRMRDAIYAAQFTYLFKDTPEGRLHGAYKNEQLGTL